MLSKKKHPTFACMSFFTRQKELFDPFFSVISEFASMLQVFLSEVLFTGTRFSLCCYVPY